MSRLTCFPLWALEEFNFRAQIGGLPFCNTKAVGNVKMISEQWPQTIKRNHTCRMIRAAYCVTWSRAVFIHNTLTQNKGEKRAEPQCGCLASTWIEFIHFSNINTPYFQSICSAHKFWEGVKYRSVCWQPNQGWWIWEQRNCRCSHWDETTGTNESWTKTRVWMNFTWFPVH